MNMLQEHGHGVLYTPAIVNAPPDRRSIEVPTLDNAHLLDVRGIRFIRIQWVDLTNTVRFRIVPRSYFSKLQEMARPGVVLTKAALGQVGLELAKGFSAAGEYLYAIDPTSFRICTYAPGHASVMGFFQEKTPSPTHGLVVPFCPRTLLKRVMDDAEQKIGVEFLVGIESEFILLRQSKPLGSETANIPPYEAVNDGDWSTSAKFPTGSVEANALDEIAERLIDAGIELQMYHAEAAPGQYEVVTGPLSPLQAADALVFTRETIRNVASRYGLRATFAPKWHADSCGNGAHMHISVHSNRPLPPPTNTAPRRMDQPLAPTLTSIERSFLQGMLTHLPALCALTLPTPASYARVQDGIWSGGTYVCWGTDNREAPIRLCGSKRTPASGGHHFELKCVDATSCAYVALAGILGVGARAIGENVQLKLGDCRTPVAQMDEEERRRNGMHGAARLPGTLEMARQHLHKDEVLGEVLGESFVEAYLNVNKTLELVLKRSTSEAAEGQILKYY